MMDGIGNGQRHPVGGVPLEDFILYICYMREGGSAATVPEEAP